MFYAFKLNAVVHFNECSVFRSLNFSLFPKLLRSLFPLKYCIFHKVLKLAILLFYKKWLIHDFSILFVPPKQKLVTCLYISFIYYAQKWSFDCIKNCTVLQFNVIKFLINKHLREIFMTKMNSFIIQIEAVVHFNECSVSDL